MNKAFISLAVLFMTATSVPITAQDTQPEYDISIPEDYPEDADQITEGKRYLIGGCEYGALYKPMEDDGIMHIGPTDVYPYPGTQLDESYFWAIEVPANSEDGRFAIKHIQSNTYIATLVFDETCTMTADIAEAALFESPNRGSFLQPDSEGGLGLVCDVYSGRLQAGWDNVKLTPLYTTFWFYDVDANNIVREKPVKIAREVTLTLPQHNGEDVVVKAQYYDGDVITVNNLPYFGCLRASSIASRNVTVSETNCSFTVKGTWDEPVYTSTDRVFTIGNKYDSGAVESWATYDYYDDLGIFSFSWKNNPWCTVKPTITAERGSIWYFSSLRFANGNYLVTIGNAMAPAGTGLTSDADGYLSFTNNPTEFILSKTYMSYGGDTENPRMSLVCCVEGKKMCFNGYRYLKTLAPTFVPGETSIDDYYPEVYSIDEPTDDGFDLLQTFETEGMTFNIDAEKLAVAKQSRSVADYLALYEPSAVDRAKLRYADLTGYPYGSDQAEIKLPGSPDLTDPLLTALAQAIEANDETAAEAALEAAKALTVSANTEYTEGAMFTLKNFTLSLVINTEEPTRMTLISDSATGAESKALEFCIVNIGDKKYIYCPAQDKFLSSTGPQILSEYGNTWILTDAASATPVDFICLRNDIADYPTDFFSKMAKHAADIIIAGSDPTEYCGPRSNREESKYDEIVSRPIPADYTREGFVGIWTFKPTGSNLSAADLAAVHDKFSPKNAAIALYWNLAGGPFYNSPYKDMTIPGYPDLSNPKLVALADAINASDDEAMTAAINALEGTTWLEPSDDITEGMVFGLRATEYPAPIAAGNGTEESPYNPTQIVDMGSTGADVWVKGYIVGVYDYNNSSSFVPGASTTVKTNIAISTAPNAADGTVIPVQIPVDELRNALNLVDNSDNLYKIVTVHGINQTYFGMPAVKSPDTYVLTRGLSGFSPSFTSISLPIAIDSYTNKLILDKTTAPSARFAVVKYEGNNYIYNLDSSNFVNAFAFSPQSYRTNNVPTAITFGVNNTGAEVEPWAKNYGVEIIGGRIIDSEKPTEGAFSWSELVADESVKVKACDGWNGSMRLSLPNEPQVLDESQLAELRARIAAADEKSKSDLLSFAEAIGDFTRVNYPTKESILAVADDDMDYRAWCYENNMYEYHTLTPGTVYTITCAGTYFHDQPTDNETDVYLSATDLEFLSFAVEGTKCVLRESVADDNAFNWLCTAVEGGIAFVHYVKNDNNLRESALTPVYLSVPGEHLGIHAGLAEPQTTFLKYRFYRGSGEVDLPVANYSDGSKTVWFPNLWIDKVSDDATDAGATTSITDVEYAATTAETFYDLCGRRVEKPARGRIYIVRDGNKTAKRLIK